MPNFTYKREKYNTLLKRLNEKRRFIQVLAGPRQCGKTTLVHQASSALNCPVHYASADDPSPQGTIWIEQQWDISRLHTVKNPRLGSVLVLDEIQKISGWSEIVKRLWDKDTFDKVNLKVLILGSAPLLIQKGLTESLAGRFEMILLTHWPFLEMQKAFGWTIEEYIFFGGYPGSSSLINDFQRWSSYIRDSLIETTISRDILLMTRVDKPALLKQLFHLGCKYSGQVLSYQKMLGQLHDAGNTTTLAHYLEFLTASGVLTGLQKYFKADIRQRASSPKLQVLNTALITSQLNQPFEDIIKERNTWGRLVESAIGAYLVNSCTELSGKVLYWREGNREVDFIIQKGGHITAIEVKSGKERDNLPGLEVFSKQFYPEKKLLVGTGGIPLVDFFSTPLNELL
ncbi:MAG: AAA family ATPase [Bacteroidota bacterium]|nr:AAA family ATPase [Bacteroidota bacterium]